MNNHKRPLRYSLRDMFIWTTIGALGLAALKYPFSWVAFVVNLAFGLSVAFALVSALANTRSRRLFSSAYAASAVVMFFIFPVNYATLLPAEWIDWLLHTVSPANIPVERVTIETMVLDPTYNFTVIANRLGLVVFSLVAAFAFSWLVRQTREPPQV